MSAPVRSETQPIAATCVHHFVLQMPNGPTSQGVCRNCGLTRVFHNSLPDDVDRVLRPDGTKPHRFKGRSITPARHDIVQGPRGTGL